MEQESVTLEQVISLAEHLTPLEKVQLIEKVAPDLEAFLKGVSVGKLNEAKPRAGDLSKVKPQASGHPLRSVYGICADLGSAPSTEDIDEMRREVFENFPREVL